MSPDRTEYGLVLPFDAQKTRTKEQEKFPQDVLPTGRWLSSVLPDFNNEYYRKYPVREFDHWRGFSETNGIPTYIDISHTTGGVSDIGIHSGNTFEHWMLDEDKGRGVKFGLDRIQMVPSSLVSFNLRGLELSASGRNSASNWIKSIVLLFKTNPDLPVGISPSDWYKQPGDLPLRTVSDIDREATLNFWDNVHCSFARAAKDKPWEFSSIEEGVDTLLRLKQLIEKSATVTSSKDVPIPQSGSLLDPDVFPR
jgi:hypothetical protein